MGAGCRIRARLGGWLVASTERTVLQLPRALVASCLAAAVDFWLLVVMVEIAGWSPVWAAVLTYCVGGMVQYILCAVWVFPYAPRNAAVGFLFFIVLSLVGLLITWATMSLAHGMAGIHYIPAKIISLGLSFWWNFLSRKYWLFRKRA